MNTFENIFAVIIKLLFFLFIAGIVLAGLPDFIIGLGLMFGGWVIIMIIIGVGNLFSNDE